ncbi:MAG: hypothetical protein ABSH20_22730, partial [Tepidisphaeraceae bacterium]
GGLVLLGVGLRGRRVDDHLLCRRCGYDLFGLPDGVYLCSECGTDLRKPRSTKIGHRARRKWLVGTSSVLMLLCLGWLGLVTYVSVRGADANRYKPAWLLLRETAGNDVQVRDAALAELFRRVSTKTVPAGTLKTLIDHALRVQDDLKKPWVPAWGDIVESAHSQGQTSTEQWNLYIKQAPQIEFRVRPRIRQGAPLPIARNYSARVGKRGDVFVKRRGTAANINGFATDDYAGRGLDIAVLFRLFNTHATVIPADDPALAKLPLGVHPLHWSLDQWIYDTAPRDFADPLPALAFGHHDFHPQFEIVAEETVTLTPRPELKDRMAKCVAARVVRGDKDTINGGVMVQSVPMPVAFEIVLRSGQKEWKAGELAAPVSSTQQWFGISAKAGEIGETCDVVLRPSRAAAEKTLDLTEIWDGEMVVKNVAVQPAPQSTTRRR